MDKLEFVEASKYDLDSYGNLEKFAYNVGKYDFFGDKYNYFEREVVKSEYFTVNVLPLTKCYENKNECSFIITNKIDLLLNATLRVKIPSIELKDEYKNHTISFKRNLMHNLIKKCSFRSNDIVVQEFDNLFLDIWNAYTTPIDKSAGYQKMILDIPFEIEGCSELTGNLPLPFFFSRDPKLCFTDLCFTTNQINNRYRI